MKEPANGINACPEQQQYSAVRAVINNLPYAIMVLLGMLLFVVGCEWSPASKVIGGLYLGYGSAGAIWIMLFVCPYCRYWGSLSCPCGYRVVSAKMRKKKDASRFNEKFKTHIPVIVPLWFVPVAAGIYALAANFSWLLLVLLAGFIIDAFVVLPLFSKKHGCADCPQKQDCPWMGAG